MARKFQIGVIGSAADLGYAKGVEGAAYEVGKYIAEKGGILFFGAEKDGSSLSTVACRGAKDAGGLTVGITYGKSKDILEKDTDIIIPCGLERGGGRETVLISGCDAVIAISGGSGTLTELAIAYQADIPMVALEGYGGWADKLAGSYLDSRERQLIIKVRSAKEAVDLAFRAAAEYREKNA